MKELFLLLSILMLIVAGATSVLMFNPSLKELKHRLKRYRKVSFIVGVVFGVLASCLMYAKAGHLYYMISPFGHKYTIMNSGYHIILPFTRIQEWEKYVDIKVVREGESTEGIEGVMGLIPIRFIDQVTATANVSVRMEIPSDPIAFMALAEEFRHPSNLVNNTLVPAVKEQVSNTGYMFAAQDYISGSASDFRQALDDQLKNGGYSVEKKEYFDTTYTDDIQNMNSRRIAEVNTRYEVEIRRKNGVPIRIEHDITKNNIKITQVIVEEIDLEPAFKKRLEQTRDIASTKRIEMEKIEAAKIRQQKIIAEGESDKAAERVAQEKEQVKKLIAIETLVKEEESNRQLAEISLQTARLNAEKVKVDADAKSYQLQKAEGLSEEKKFMLEIAAKERIEVAKALAGPNGITFPANYITAGGGDSKNQTDPLMLLLWQTLQDKSK